MKTLLQCREAIDRIDTEIIALLEKRSKIVDNVAKIKKNNPIKLAHKREITMIYSLLKKNAGAYKPRSIYKLWRELIMATLDIEGNFHVSLFLDKNLSQQDNRILRDITLDYFGTNIPTTTCSNLTTLFDQLNNNQTTIAILPYDSQQPSCPFIPLFFNGHYQEINIIHKLPFFPWKDNRNASVNALCVAKLPYENTEKNNTLIATKIPPELTAETILKICRQSLPVHIITHFTHHKETYLLMETNGYINKNTPSFSTMSLSLKDNNIACSILGGYSLPIDIEPLKNESQKL